jgi:WbqC-like protein family
MQPYFFPYIGYFQLINNCSEFIIYDDVQYTKKGWINRNKVASGQNVFPITINISKHKEASLIKNILISKEFSREKLFRRISGANAGSQYKAEVDGLIREIIMFQTDFLFEYLFHSIKVLSGLLDINTPLKISSEVGDFEHLKGEDKVIQICNQLGAKVYLNPMGGMHLYSKKRFSDHGMSLKGFESKLAPIDMDNSERVTLSIVNSLYKEGIVRTSARAREEIKLLDSNY